MNVTRPPASLSEWISSGPGGWSAVLPDYGGGSIANLPASILSHFGAMPDGSEADICPPLRREIAPAELFDGARVVVLVVLDGLGSHALSHARSQGLVNYLNGAHTAGELTSVFPSTTATALTTLQTGATPLRHGVAGYSLFLEDQKATVSMITWKAIGGMPLATPMPDPARYLPVPTIYQLLDRAGVGSVLVSNLAFSDSPLTNLQASGVPYSGHRTPAEFAGLLLHETLKPNAQFIFGYWDGFDALAHTHGAESEICLNEIYLLDQALGRGFFEPLRSAGRDDVAVLVTADHGHVTIDQERVVPLRSVVERYCPGRPVPTGDRRATGLPVDTPEGRAALERLADGVGLVMPTADAISRGLYGTGAPSETFESRIGSTLLLATRDGAFMSPRSTNRSAGGHGSLTEREMLVPLLGWRF